MSSLVLPCRHFNSFPAMDFWYMNDTISSRQASGSFSAYPQPAAISLGTGPNLTSHISFAFFPHTLQMHGTIGTVIRDLLQLHPFQYPQGFCTLIFIFLNQKILNQYFLFLPAHMLNCIFPAHSLLLRSKLLIVNQLYRAPAFCILCPAASVMRYNTFLYVVRPACIQASVTTFQYVSIIHAPFSLLPILNI